MKYYFAPMEGITGYIYRNTYHKYFGGFDKYFTPFIAPAQKKSLKTREKNDILPEHNEGMYVVPQILCCKSQDFIRTARDLLAYGYKEINLNLGCPSGTVVTKGKGAGFLADTEKLDAFLEDVFSQCDAEISIKTRLGMEHPEEAFALMDIYNKYPLKELIIHPRVRKEFYTGEPHRDVYEQISLISKAKVCYNGDLFTALDIADFKRKHEKTDCVMLGRGMLRNPGLLLEAKGQTATKSQVHDFICAICDAYEKLQFGDTNVLFKMKELWSYLGSYFPDDGKVFKKIKKAKRLVEYRLAVEEIFR